MMNKLKKILSLEGEKDKGITDYKKEILEDLNGIEDINTIWEKEKRERIDTMFSDMLIDSIKSYPFDDDIKLLLRKFIQLDENNITYEDCESIKSMKIIINRKDIKGSLLSSEIINPIVNKQMLNEIKFLITGLLEKNFSDEWENKIRKAIMGNYCPYILMDIIIGECIKNEDLPNSIRDEFNVLNIAGLTPIDYKNAQDHGFQLYWNQYVQNRKERENQVDKEKLKSLVVVLTTMYKNVPPYRKELGLSFLEKLNKLGISSVLGDGGSDEDFLNELTNQNKFGLTKVIKCDGSGNKIYGGFFGNDKRSALKEAIRLFPVDENPGTIFLQTEPEKTWFSDVLNLELLVNGMKDKEMIFPNRKTKISLPKLHAAEETRAANVITSLSGYDKLIDVFQSASVCTHQGADYFLDYSPIEKETYDGVMVPFIQAFKDGLSVGTVDVEASYSWKEKIYEQRGSGRDIFTNKRVFMQYQNLIPTIKHQIDLQNLSKKLQNKFPDHYNDFKITPNIIKNSGWLNNKCIFDILYLGNNDLVKSKIVEWIGEENKKFKNANIDEIYKYGGNL